MAHGMHGKHGILFISHRWHKFHFFILPQTSFSPTDCTDNTDSFFLFLDMKTREHDFFSRRLLFLTELFFSHGTHGMHGNAVAAPACHPDLTIRSLTASNALYGLAQIFSVLRPSGRTSRASLLIG